MGMITVSDVFFLFLLSGMDLSYFLFVFSRLLVAWSMVLVFSFLNCRQWGSGGSDRGHDLINMPLAMNTSTPILYTEILQL